MTSVIGRLLTPGSKTSPGTFGSGFLDQSEITGTE